MDIAESEYPSYKTLQTASPPIKLGVEVLLKSVELAALVDLANEQAQRYTDASHFTHITIDVPCTLHAIRTDRYVFVFYLLFVSHARLVAYASTRAPNEYDKISQSLNYMLCSLAPFPQHVAETLEFNAHLTNLALLAIRRLRRINGPSFNGLHLRVEEDASDWASAVGGDEVRHLYLIKLLRRHTA